jgi:hypothetical protein
VSGLPQPPTITVLAYIANALEAGLVSGSFRFSRTGDTSQPLTVYFTTTGTATAGSDYVALPPSVQFPVGAATVNVPVTPIDDTLVESNETVVLSLSGNVGYLPGNPATATVTIVSDDVAPDLVVSALTAPTTGGAGSAISVSATTKNQAADRRRPRTRATTCRRTPAWMRATPRSVQRDSRARSRRDRSQPATLTIPATTTTGTYYVLAQADGDGALVETVESNNVRAVQIRIGPDLNVAA